MAGRKERIWFIKKERCIIQYEIKYIMKEKSKSVITFLIESVSLTEEIYALKTFDFFFNIASS